MPMNRKQRLQLAAQRRAEPQAVPIPITGWNTRDALANMDPGDAVLLDNWYPDANGCTVRQGYASYATGLGSGAVTTLAEYNAQSTRKFLAAANGAFYDISSPGAVGAPLASGFANSWWQSCLFNKHLFFVNGADAPQVFDGSAMSAASWSGTSFTPANIKGVTAFSNRLFLWENANTGFWYGPLLGIAGTFTFFDLSMLTELGGNVAAITSVSYDGGSGVSDFLVIMMTSGEVFAYQGTDPSTTGTWALVGRYRVSPPVNVRAVVRYGGESWFTSFDDHVAVMQSLVALRSGVLPPRSKACGAVKAAVMANPNANGWQALYYTQGRRIIFNVPNLDGTYAQHVYNVTNDAWTRFINHPSACWGLFQNNLYFGGSSGGVVYQADTGNLDQGVNPIYAHGQQAWNTFGSAERKQVHAVRPVIESFGGCNYVFDIGFDYGDINTGISSNTIPEGSPWDVSPWDTSPWSPENVVDPNWHGGAGNGVAVSWQLVLNATTAITWERTDVWYEMGSGL